MTPILITIAAVIGCAVAFVVLGRGTTPPAAMFADPKSVEFDVDRSATGTHYVAMSLTREKHDPMLKKRNAA